jgi:iron complex transport system substrate-binding protein
MIRWLLPALAALTAADAHALQASDDRGVAVSLARPAARIVTLAPHLAEIAYAAGVGAKLVGVSTFSRRPPEAERLPMVASAGRVDIERLIALRPDLVLAWQSGNPPLQVERLERIGMRVFATEVHALSDIPRIVRAVGVLGGSAELAERSAGDFESEIARLRERYAAKPRVAVLVEVWHRPMLTVSGAHLISDALAVCGGRNVFAASKTLTPLVSREQVLEAQPRAIVTGGLGSEAPSAWRGFELVQAVRGHRIYSIDPDSLYAQGPHVLEGVRALCQRLDQARD